MYCFHFFSYVFLSLLPSSFLSSFISLNHFGTPFFNITIYAFMTAQFIYVSDILKKKRAIIFLTMNRLICVMGTMCVHCEVGTEFLNNICLYKFLISKC